MGTDLGEVAQSGCTQLQVTVPFSEQLKEGVNLSSQVTRSLEVAWLQTGSCGGHFLLCFCAAILGISRPVSPRGLYVAALGLGTACRYATARGRKRVSSEARVFPSSTQEFTHMSDWSELGHSPLNDDSQGPRGTG